MKDKKWIWLDMDGSIANLYGVDDWLKQLIAQDPTPYLVAEPMVDMMKLALTLLDYKDKGYSIGVISWLSKTSTPAYDIKVTSAKQKWLEKYGLDLILDKTLIVPYGQNKADICRKYGKGILIDDEEPNRDSWDLGLALDPTKMLLETLIELLEREI